MLFNLGFDSNEKITSSEESPNNGPNLGIGSLKEGELNGRQVKKTSHDPHLDLKFGISFGAFVLSFILTCVSSKWVESSKIADMCLIASATGFLVSTGFFIYYLRQMMKERDETTNTSPEVLAL
jgi:hypothetical protein